MDIFEHVLYEDLSQGAKSFAYYKMVIGERYYETQQEHITIKVMADNYFDSDPDVFISKTNQEPTSSLDSEWYCERSGSETCVINNGEFEIGETLYIGVKCDRQCKYMLRAWFTKETDLFETSRIQIRFDGYSTQILKYYIESETDEGASTESIEIIVSPEDTHKSIEAHVSLDTNFYLIEEKPATQIVENGIAIKFGQNDYQWCVKCYIYVILNIEEEGRYYITSQGRYENDYLSETIPTQVLVNPFSQECFGYFVLRTKEDLMWTIKGYAGHADVYISARGTPDGPNSNRIIMRGGHGSDRKIVVKADQRSDFGYSTGTYSLCFYAYTPFSAKITTLEKDFESQYDYLDGQVLTQTIYKGDSAYGRYQNSALRQRGRLNVYLSSLSDNVNMTEVKIWYRLCQDSSARDCNLTSGEARGESREGYPEMKTFSYQNANGVDNMFMPGSDNFLFNQQGGAIYGFIDHNPEDCLNTIGQVISCTYLIAIENLDEDNDGIVSFYIEGEFFNPGDIYLGQSYVNTINHGQSISYELNVRRNPEMEYLKMLKIKLSSLHGDADLYVSFTNTNPTSKNYQLYKYEGEEEEDDTWLFTKAKNYDLASRSTHRIDEVVISEQGGLDMNSLNRTIYFNVYGFTRSQYEITFEYEFLDSYNEKLEDAYQIGDGRHIKEFLESEYDERLYKFRPWWSKNENRTMIFLADVIYNRVFFYSQWKDYPKHFLTTKHDVNETIAIYGDDADYHHNGDYYIRLRPDFALYDLLSDREYVYWMYAFSQPPANGGEQKQGFQLLELSVNQIGFTNETNYQDYRYVIVDMSATFDITLTRVPGQGKPVFFVKMMNSQEGNFQYSQLPRSDGYHFKSSENEEKSISVQNLTLTPDMRTSRLGKCAFLKSSLQEDGAQDCFLAISVQCGEDENNLDCAYNLRVDQQGFDYTEQSSKAVEDFIPSIPQPLFEEEYVNGNVSFNQIKYYYFPVAKEDYGNSLILLNKTQIYGSGQVNNGDSRMLINLQNNTSDDNTGFNYTQWLYPNDNRAGAITQTLNNTWPEIIEPCEEIMTDFCDNADGCTYVIGVAGGTNLTRSSYRIKGFRGHNKMHMNTPIVKNIPGERDGQNAYDYYWFVINDTVVDPNIQFDYQVSVGSPSGNDPDLFVSVMDGRWPTDEDYDFKSSLQGADSVRIASNDSFWQNNGWSTQAGVAVVVGVKQQEVGDYTLLLTHSTPKGGIKEIERITVGKTVLITLPELEDQDKPRGFSSLFQLYNWGHQDFEFQLEINKGNASLMMQRAGQDILSENIYTGIPIDANNSKSVIVVDANNDTIGSTNSIFIAGDDCFNCWYFVHITVDYPGETQFSFSTPRMQDSGGPAEIKVGNFGQIYILANFNTVRQFILDSKDNFIIEATVASGEVDMYVGLDPDTLPGDALWSAKTEGSLASLSIKTTDKNFHVGTYYYIYLAAGSDNDALLNLHLKQQRSVEFVPNNHDSTYELDHQIFNDELLYVKFQYQSVGEEIKFHVIQVPGAIADEDPNGAPFPRYFVATITVEALTPHFYPQIYMKQVGFEEQPSELNTLEFPTVDEYEFAFGENPLPQLQNNRFVYTFKGMSTDLFTYYTIAMYQNNWQLTDYKKTEYRIKVDVDVCEVEGCEEYGFETAPEEQPISSSPGGNNRGYLKDDGSYWQWMDYAERSPLVSADGGDQTKETEQEIIQ